MESNPVLQSLLDLFQNPDSTSDVSNIPPPPPRIDYAGNETSVPMHLNINETPPAIMSVPASAQFWKNLSLDMAGADPKTIHPQVGMSVEEIDQQYRAIVERSAPY